MKRQVRTLLAVALSAGLSGCHRGLRQDATKSRTPVPVTVATVERQLVSRPLDLSGTVIARNQVSIVPKATGRILELAVDEGYRIKRGQVVAILDTPEVSWQVQQQRSAVATAQANLDGARDNVRRMKDLASEGVISDQQLFQAQTQLRVANSQLRESRAALALMKNNLDNRVVTSPVSGVVVQRILAAGAMANPASPIVTIAQGEYQAKLAFAEQDLPAIHDSLHLALTADALPGQVFTGTVSDIAEMVDPQTHLLSCKVDLADKGRLRIGMNVRATVPTESHEALVIPTDALLNDGSQTVVYLADAGKAREVPVIVGDRDDQRAEIRSGLAIGERVIEKGNVFVHDGDPVAVSAKIKTKISLLDTKPKVTANATT